MNLKIIILLTLFLQISALSFAQPDQKKYGKGYIVTNTNDTLHGYLRRFKETEARLYKKVFFLRDTVEEIKYKPDDIKAFCMDSSFYITRSVNGTFNSFNHFFKVLSKGKVALYTTIIQQSGGGMMMSGASFGSASIMVPVGGGSSGGVIYYIETDKEFRSVGYGKESKSFLREIFKDCSAIEIKDKPRFFDMEAVVKTYNSCFDNK